MSTGAQDLSKLAQLSKQAMEDSERWFGNEDGPDVCHSIPHMTLALTGEVGEFANIVKKIERGSLRMGDAKVRMAMMEEIADVFTYTLLLAGLMGIDLEKAYMHKRHENNIRFGKPEQNGRRR